MLFKSQLSPGIYYIQNVSYNSHAVLYNDDEPTNLYSDVLQGDKVGPKVRLGPDRVV